MKNRSSWTGGVTLTLAMSVALALAMSVTATRTASAELGVSRQPIVYGQDDRVEVYQTARPVLADRARHSVAALLLPHALEYTASGDVSLRDLADAPSLNLCPEERFREQPSPARCSAVLVDDDLLATAGHCLGENQDEVERSCIELAAVFGLSYEGPGRLSPMTADDVYRCREVVAWSYGAGDRLAPDLAVIQLDRGVVPPLRPAPMALAAPTMGQRVHAISFTAGLPAKIDSGGRVMEVGLRRSYFGADTDTFGGSSGGPIFNDAGEVLGLIVRGGKDYALDGPCAEVVRASGGFEDVQVSEGLLTQICARGWPSQRLCGSSPRCGDGACTFAESAESCPDDCTAPRCGDGRCELSEPLSCAPDCDRAARVPATWTCPVEYYQDGLGCDCDCGARDIDCDDPAQELLMCPAGWACSAAGYCLTPDGEQATRDGERWVVLAPAPESAAAAVPAPHSHGCSLNHRSPPALRGLALLVGLGLLRLGLPRPGRRRHAGASHAPDARATASTLATPRGCRVRCRPREVPAAAARAARNWTVARTFARR